MRLESVSPVGKAAPKTKALQTNSSTELSFFSMEDRKLWRDLIVSF